MKKSSYFIRYLVLFAAAVFLFFCIIIGLCTRSILTGLEHSDYINNLSDYQVNKSNVENSFNIALAMGRMMTEYECVKQYAASHVAYEDTDFFLVKEIYNALRKNQTDFANMKLNMSLLKENSDLIINSSSTMTKEEFLEEKGIDAGDIIETFSSNSLNGYYYDVLKNSEKNEICLVCQRRYNGDDVVYLLVTFELGNIEYVYDEVTDKGFAVSGGLDIEVMRKVAALSPMHDTAVIKKIDIGDATLIYSFLSNSPNTYYIHRYNDSSRVGLIVICVIVVIMCALLSVIVSYFITKAVYRPIGRLFGVLDEEDDFSDGDEIEFLIGRAVRIKNTNYMLNEKLDTLKNKFLFDLINGFVWGKGIEDGIKEHNLGFLKEICVCVLFGAEQTMKPDFDQRRRKAFEIAGQKLLKDNRGAALMLENRRMLFITVYSKTEKQQILSAIEAAKEYTGIQLAAAFGNPIHGYDEYKNVYLDLSLALDRKYILGNRDVITPQCTGGLHEPECVYSFETERILDGYIMSGEREKAMLLLRRILDKALYDESLSQQRVDEFRFAIMASVRRMLQNIGKTPEELFPSEDSAWNQMECQAGREEFGAAVTEVIKKIANVVNDEAKNDEDRVCAQILEYIQQNLSNDLSMDDICQKFNMSASTVTRRLKEKYNIGFKSYLNEIRIERAKNIMRQNPEVMIKDVAEQVGYNNTVTFNRLFKKYEGISPSQYMKNIGNDDHK